VNNKTLIENARQKCLDGVVLSREEIIRLLQISDEDNADSHFLRETAFDVAKLKSGGKAYLWGAIGIDYVACPMNCDFCSFGAEWGIIREEIIFTREKIADDVRKYVDNKVHYIVFRTSQFYDVKVLESIVLFVRKQVPGNYELVLNTGEFDKATADRLHKAGVSCIYHAIRLREGIDTRFDINARRATLKAIHDSDLKLVHLVEPVGYEHTYEEIADRFLESLEYGVTISGIMARIPVAGTPLGKAQRISDDKIAGLIAVIRLSGGNIVKDICVHPASEKAVRSGANVVVIEKGAIPRDADISNAEWNQFGCSDAISLFINSGYTIA
jgi:biotin synthase